MIARLFLLLLALPCAAQVRQTQTISSTEGGFAGPLADGDRFGIAATGIGDLDGDGTPDLAVGATGDDQSRGAVWVLFLNPDGTVRQSASVRPPDGSPGDFFGGALAFLGDLDGDGDVELAIGADHADDGGPDRGSVRIVSLAADGTARVRSTISATSGGLTDLPADGDLFGHSVAALGDLDGDGRAELAVGADDADDGGPERGAVWILFLNADGRVRQSQRISDTAGGFDGALDDRDLFGQAVAGIGDVDGDGTPDLAVAATLDDDGTPDTGAVWMLFLRPDGTVRQAAKISATAGGFMGELETGDVFGSSLVAPGDLDRDGVPDLLVGANGDDDGGPGRGAGWVLLLRRDGTVRAHQKISATTGGAFGPTVDGDSWNPTAALGDLDGDGGADVVWGARLADDGGTNRGAARVLFTGYATPSEPSPTHDSARLGVPVPNPTTSRVRFETEAPPGTRLVVTDALGRVVARLAPAHGITEVDVSGWAAGIYLVRLGDGGERAVRTFVVTR